MRLWAVLLLLLSACEGSDIQRQPSDPCATVHCGDFGICDNGTCFCRSGYTGERCQEPPGGFVPDAGSLADGGSVGGADAGSSGSCAPDQIFCSGSQARLCASDGRTSVLRSDCATTYAVVHDCTLCAPTVPGCSSPTPYATGSVQFGSTSFSISAASTCELPNNFIQILTGGVEVLEMNIRWGAGLGGDSYLQVRIDRNLVTNGASFPLYRSTNPNVYVRTNTFSCQAYDSNSTPPSNGNVSFSFPGALEPGTPLRVQISGYFRCGANWDPVSVDVTAIVINAI